MLKNLRETRGLSLKIVASALNIGISTLSEYESNKTEPSLSRFISLLDFYNVDPYMLLIKNEEYINITNYSPSSKAKVIAIDKLENAKFNQIH